MENPAAAKIDEKHDTLAATGVAPLEESYREESYYYEDWENISEPPDAGEIDDRHSDSSDFEETYIKKKKKASKAKVN